MRKVWKLAFAFLTEYPIRVVLTTIATIAATCMVIWIASSYDALLKTFDVYSNLALGRYPLAIAPISSTEPGVIPDEVVSELRADSNVAVVDPIWAGRLPLRPVKPAPEANKERPSRSGRVLPEQGAFAGGSENPGGSRSDRPPGRNRTPLVIATRSPEASFPMKSGEWHSAKTQETPSVVVRADTAERLGIKLGDEIQYGNGDATLRVIGILDAPALTGAAANAAGNLLTPSSGEYYLDWETAEKVVGEKLPARLLGIGLKEGVDLHKFRFSWAPRLSKFATPVQFQEAHDIEEALDEANAARNVQVQSLVATAIAVLVAFLVIFCTLSMGVSDRVRQLAILRAVVLTRGQVAQLIILESLLLAALGFVGGLAVSWVILKASAYVAAKTMYHGAEIGVHSLTMAAAATFGAALLAALVPALRATRVKPLEAMSSRPELSAEKPLASWTWILGLALIAINPLLAFFFPPRFDEGVVTSIAIGFVTTAAGFVLLAPSVVVFVDRWLSPVLAKLFGVKPQLLASQLTSHLWRTVGAAISMAVGMGLYIAVQVWGYTMLDGFIVGDWAPDALLAFRPAGLTPEQVAEVSKIAGIAPLMQTPVVVEQPRLAEDLTHSAERASVTRQDNVVLVGLIPDVAFGPTPLLKLEWVAGSPAEAIAGLKSGRGCVVPDHFLKETGLALGDSFSLVPPEKPKEAVSYKIVGVVRLLGWHWLTKTTGFRTKTHRAAALVFANYQTVSEDFSLPRASHLWFDYANRNPDTKALAEQARANYKQQLNQPVSVGRNANGGASVQLMPVEDIRNATRGAARRWLWIISQIPLLALLITSFGVLNVMLASVRARRWEIGILRSLGFTRSAIVRSILAEGLLIGIVAAILSVGFGTMIGWCGCEFTQYISFFGGMHPDLVVPWTPILVGIAALLGLMFLTAVWPAWDIGRTKPLTLLLRGRGAF